MGSERARDASISGFANVLCAIDGSRGSLAAVRQAAALAVPGGQLALLAVDAAASEEDDGRMRGLGLGAERVEHALEVAGQLARRSGVRCARAAKPVALSPEAILARAGAHDLLALGATARSPIAESLLAAVACSAAGSLPAPLLLARPAPSEQPFGRRILVASDARAGSDGLVELAAALARRLGGGVMLVHATPDEPQSRPQPIDRQVAALEATLADAYEVHVEAGAAPAAIVRIAAGGQVSLIVLGSRRPGGRRMLGSVSERIIRHAPCSALAMPL